MNWPATSASPPWQPLPGRGLVGLACEAGAVRDALVASTAMLVGNIAAPPFMQAVRTGRSLYLSSKADPESSLARWTSPESPHIIKKPWHGTTKELIGLIRSAAEDVAVVFVDSGAASPDWQRKAETFDLLEFIAEDLALPIVVLVDPVRGAVDLAHKCLRTCAALGTC